MVPPSMLKSPCSHDSASLLEQPTSAINQTNQRRSPSSSRAPHKIRLVSSFDMSALVPTTTLSTVNIAAGLESILPLASAHLKATLSGESSCLTVFLVPPFAS